VHDVLKGAFLGFLLAAPVGPIGLLCITRTLRSGWLAGFVSGMGAATADTFYACVAAFGIKTIISAFSAVSQPLHLVGAAFLCYLGYVNLTSRKAPPANATPGLAAYASTVALTLVNPATIFSFMAIFAAAMGPGSSGGTPGALLLTGGVFVGSTLWWLLLASLAGAARTVLAAPAIALISRISGGVLIGFAVWVVMS
jgi:threonine/homoserine/homoserine lactone efflux protein